MSHDEKRRRTSPPGEGAGVAQPAQESDDEWCAMIKAVCEHGDLGPALGIEPFRRVEVLWDVGDSDSEEGEGEMADQQGSSGGVPVWWGATIVGKTDEVYELGSGEQDDDEEEEENDDEGVKHATKASQVSPSSGIENLNHNYSSTSSTNLTMPNLVASSSLSTLASERTAVSPKEGGNDVVDKNEIISEGEVKGLAVPVYELRYDARPPEFPTPTVYRICFTAEHHMWDIETRSLLPWRFEGDTWEPPSEEEEEDDVEDGSRAFANPILVQIEEELKRQLDEERDGIVNDLPGAESSASTSTDGTTIPFARMMRERMPRAPLSPEDSALICRQAVDGILKALAQRHGQRLLSLPFAQQGEVLRRLAHVQTRLVEEMAAVLRRNGTITPADAVAIIATIRMNLNGEGGGEEQEDEVLCGE